MKTLIAFVLVALLAASCGGDGLPDEVGDAASTTSPDDQPDTSAAVTPATAVGDLDVVPVGSPAGDWQLVEGVDLVDGFPITMAIDGAGISGRAACNSYGGTITVDGNTVSFGEFSWTEMGCEQPVMEAERLFLAALLSTETFALDGDRLTLTGPDGELLFEPVVPTPTAELIGTTWILDTLIEGETATSVGGEPATLLLSADGTLTASTGCRSVTGEWLEHGGSIIAPIMSAEGECPDDLWKQDSLVITVLEGEFRATVDGDRLTLTSMGGDGLVYHHAG